MFEFLSQINQLKCLKKICLDKKLFPDEESKCWNVILSIFD